MKYVRTTFFFNQAPPPAPSVVQAGRQMSDRSEKQSYHRLCGNLGVFQDHSKSRVGQRSLAGQGQPYTATTLKYFLLFPILESRSNSGPDLSKTKEKATNYQNRTERKLYSLHTGRIGEKEPQTLLSGFFCLQG